MIWIAHDLAQVRALAASVTCVNRTVLFSGPPREVLASFNAEVLFSQVLQVAAEPADRPEPRHERALRVGSRQYLMALAFDGTLPLSFQYGFVINALLCAFFIGPVLGGVGTMVVTKRMAFFSQAIGNAAMTGVAIGVHARRVLHRSRTCRCSASACCSAWC